MVTVASGVTLCDACIAVLARVALRGPSSAGSPDVVDFTDAAATFFDAARSLGDLARAYEDMGLEEDAARSAAQAMKLGAGPSTARLGAVVFRWLAPSEGRRAQLRRMIQAERALS